MTLPSAYSHRGELHIDFPPAIYEIAVATLTRTGGKKPRDRQVRELLRHWAQAGMLRAALKAADYNRLLKGKTHADRS